MTSPSAPSPHETYMRMALAIARRQPRRPFGAVIVDRRSGLVLAQGWNRFDENPVWHAEIDAIERCGRRAPGGAWEDRVLYTTAEPCPMCQAAVMWAGIPRVYYGSSIAFLQAQGLAQIDIGAHELARRTPFHACELVGGILEAECNALFAATAGAGHPPGGPARAPSVNGTGRHPPQPQEVDHLGCA